MINSRFSGFADETFRSPAETPPRLVFLAVPQVCSFVILGEFGDEETSGAFSCSSDTLVLILSDGGVFTTV